jgi:hypothetical protein
MPGVAMVSVVKPSRARCPCSPRAALRDVGLVLGARTHARDAEELEEVVVQALVVVASQASRAWDRAARDEG